MGRGNYLIDGVSGTGKSSVREELQRRGYQPSTVTMNWLTRAIRKPASQCRASPMSTTSGQ